MSADLEASIVDVFRSNPFVSASVVTIHNHLAARGWDVDELTVRDCCENLVDDGVLAFDREVYGRVKYSHDPE